MADIGDKGMGIQLILIGGRDGVKGDPAANATAILTSIISMTAGIAPSEPLPVVDEPCTGPTEGRSPS